MEASAAPDIDEPRKHASRPHDVLDLLLADVGEGNIETSVHLIAHGTRDADAARLGQRLQPCRNIYAVSRNVGAVDDDVAQVDANAELDALVGRLRVIIYVNGPLHVDGATECGVRAAEFEQHPVAGGLDDAAAMFCNLRIDDALPNRPQPSERSSVVAFHVPAEADHSAMRIAARLRVTALRFTITPEVSEDGEVKP